MMAIELTQMAETDGGDRVERKMDVVPGPNFHYGEVIEPGEKVKTWVHIQGEPQLFYVTESMQEIRGQLNEIG